MIQKLASPALMDFGLFQTDRLQAMYQAATMGQPAPLDLLWGVAMVAQWLEEFF